MRARVDDLFYLAADVSGRALGDCKRAVLRPLDRAEARKLIDGLAAPEAEPLEQIERRRLGNDRRGEVAGLFENLVGVILFIDRQSELHGGVGNLRQGVDDAGVVVLAAHAQHIQAVTDFCQHKKPSFERDYITASPSRNIFLDKPAWNKYILPG